MGLIPPRWIAMFTRTDSVVRRGKNMNRLRYLLLLLAAPGVLAWGQTTYTWNQSINTDYADAGNWTPSRSTPASTDVLVIDGSGTPTPTLTNIQTESIGRLVLINSTSAAMSAIAARTLTVAGGAGTDFEIEGGSTLSVSGASAISFALSAGATGSIAGQITVAGGGHRLTGVDASSITFQSGSVFTTSTGFTGNAFGTTGLNSILFASGSQYVHNAGSNPFGAATPNSVVVFQGGSTAVFRTTTGYAASGRTFANLTVQNSIALSGSGGSNFQIETLNVESGSSFTHTGSGTATVTVLGNISSAGSGSITITGGSGGIQLNSGGLQTIGGGGGSGTITFGSSATVGASTTVAVSRTLTFSAGTMTVNGMFQINQGGFTSGPSDYSYGGSSTLVFNNSSGSYGVSSGHIYWPASGGPTHVTVAGSGGVTMNVSRSVTGTLQTAAGVTNGNNLTISGTVQLNAGGFFTGSPVYSGTPTLVYNTGGSYGVGAEWTTGTSVGAGVPANVTILNSTTVDMPNSDRTVPGSVQISNGALVLHVSSGDLNVGSNWTRSNTATFTSNNRAVFFNGTGNQTVTVTGGGTESFTYLILDKPAGDLVLAASTNAAVTATTGDVLQLLNSGGIDLNGQTLTLSGSGGNIRVSGGARTVGGSSGTLSATGGTTVSSSGGGTLATSSGVTVALGAGLDFGAGISTVNGTMQINPGGFVNNNPPAYGSGSTLQYATGGTYGRSLEWSTTSGAGYPANVHLTNSTILDLGNGGTGTARQMSGSLTIDAGSALDMDLNPMTASVTVVGDVNIGSGRLTLSSAAGGNLFVGGGWTFGAGTFQPNGRNVTFNGTTGQSLNGSTTFDLLTIDKLSGVLSLSNTITVNTTLSLDNGVVSTGANKVSLASGATVTRTSGHVHGNMEKSFPAGVNAFQFAIGDASSYTPVDLAAFNVTTPGTITAATTSGDHPNLPASTIAPARSVNRFWTLTKDPGLAFISYDPTFTFLPGDVDGGASTALFDIERYDGSWTPLTTGTRTATSTQATGVTSFSDFAIGEPAAGPLDNFLVETVGGGSIPMQTAGASFSIQITARDAGNNTVTAFTGTVDITSTGTLSAGGGTTANFVNGVLASHGVTISNTGSFTLTATNSAGPENGISNSFTVDPGPLDHYLVEAAGGGSIPTQTAGSPFAVRITAQDVNDNTVTGFVGTVDVTSTGTLSSGSGTTASFTAGVLSSHSVTISNTGTFTITATTTAGAENGTSNNFTVDPGALDNFLVEANGGGAIPSQSGGTPFSIQVTARDANNNTVTGFGGTVDITSTGTLIAGGGTTTSFTSGQLTGHSVTIANTGNFTITATNTSGPEDGTSNAFTVNVGPLDNFLVEAAGGGAIGAQTAGVSFDLQVTARDAGGNTVTAFSGTVDITSSGTLLAGGGTTASFTAGILNPHAVTISSSGNHTVTATLTSGTESGTSNSFAVNHATLDHFAVETTGGGAIPTQAATVSFDVQVTAQDAFDNTVTSFTGTADMTSTGTLSSGGGTTAPLTAGVLATHALTISSVGSFSVTATLTAGLETGTSNLFTVTHGPLDNFLVEASGGGPVGSQTAGVPFDIQVIARDPAGNTVTSFGGTTEITSSGSLSSGGGTTPAFTNGVLSPHSVTVTSSGSVSITATNSSGPESGTSNLFTVDPSTLDHFLVEADGGGVIPSQVAGTPFDIQVTAQDAFDNTVVAFTGTVEITSTGTLSSGGGTTASFVSGVLSPHSVTITNTGTFDITATNSSGPETGTSNAFAVQPGSLNNYLIEAAGGGSIPSQTAGVPFDIQITARDINNNTVTAFTGTVDISSTGILLSGSGTTSNFSSGVLASHSVSISNAGSFTVTATTTAGSETGSSNSFSVDPGPLDHFDVEEGGGGSIPTQIAQESFGLQITAKDFYENTVTSFTGTVDVTSTGTLTLGGGTTAPFVSGVLDPHDVRISNTGTFTITATRTGSGETGTSNAFDVEPGPLHNFLVEADGGGPIGTQAVALQFDIQITARDIANNTVTDFTGTVDVSSSGALYIGAGTTPNFVDGVLAGHTLEFAAPGLVTVTATRSGGSETGTSLPFQVNQTYYMITATAGAGGSIFPSGAVAVPHGANREFIMSADAGFIIDDVEVDGGSIGPVGSYTFTGVVEPHTIHATYVPLTVFLSVPPESILVKDPATGRFQKPARRGRGLRPNWANLMSETVFQGGFQPGATESDEAGGMRVGISEMVEVLPNKWKPDVDFARERAWVRLTKWSFPRTKGSAYESLHKTLEDRTGIHEEDPRGFDYVGNPELERPLLKQWTILPPRKHNNSLFAEMVALKLTIAASQLGKIPIGFGELVYENDGHVCDELSIVEISAKIDTMLTYWEDYSGSEFDAVYDAIYDINRAFAGPVDTVRFGAGGQLVLRGAVELDDVPFLKAGVVAARRLTPTNTITEDVEEFEDYEFDEGTPVAAKLYQNYPNPFNPSTTIGFRLREPSMVSVTLFNLLGQEVAGVLHREELDEGYNTVDVTLQHLSSGVYFYRLVVESLETGELADVMTRKMILLK